MLGRRTNVLLEATVIAQKGGPVHGGRDEVARLEWHGVQHRRRDILANEARRRSDLLNKELHHLGVELGSGAVDQRLAGLLGGPWLSGAPSWVIAPYASRTASTRAPRGMSCPERPAG